ncbi:MAG: hypothetical protein ABW012_04860 [Gaiellaceae bacterium]
MDIDATPAVTGTERDALLVALERTDVRPRGTHPYESKWRLAGLREAADDDEDARYAFSPRRTRGATRA